MKRFVEYPLEGGNSIIVELDEPDKSGTEPVGRSNEIIEKVDQKFETVIEKIKPTASAIINTLRELSDSPNEIGVEFGVKLNTKAGLVLASAGAEANYKVSLKWMKREQNV